MDDSKRFDKNALPGNDPTPSQVYMKQEEWGLFLRKQPLVYRRIFVLLRDGKSYDEIATELGMSRRTVQRIVLLKVPGVNS